MITFENRYKADAYRRFNADMTQILILKHSNYNFESFKKLKYLLCGAQMYFIYSVSNIFEWLSLI